MRLKNHIVQTLSNLADGQNIAASPKTDGLLGIVLAKISALQGRIFDLEAELRLRKREAQIHVPKAAQPAQARRFAPEPLHVAPVPTPVPPMFHPAGEPIAAAAPARPEPDFSASLPEIEVVESGTASEATPPFVAAITRFITGGNLMVKIGVIILFFGVSFLVKFAAEKGMIPIELRLALVTVGAIVLLVLGWRLRERREQYALVLQGGGVGVLYLTIFAAFRLYALLPAPLAFALLVSICALSSALAVIQESRTLAVLGASGGFLAPILASTGSGSHVALFSYYAVLNAGIIGIAWFRAWRILNLVGFAFTFVIGAFWGTRFYTPELFASTEPFLILFFIMYSAVAVLFALRQEPDLKGYVDGTLVFGTPIAVAGLQASLVSLYQYGLAWSALGLGLYYILLASWLFSRDRRTLRFLSESFLAFGVVFATLAIPLALDGRWSAAAWSIEGAAMVWAGLRQCRWLVRLFGILLLFGGGLFFALDLPDSGTLAVLNGFWLGTALISGASLFASRLFSRDRDALEGWERSFSNTLLAWGLLWWYGGGFTELSRWLDVYQLSASLAFAAATSYAFAWVSKRLEWDALLVPALLLLPVLCLTLLTQALSVAHPLARGGYLAWPLAAALYYLILSSREERVEKFQPPLHAVPIWLWALLLAWETSWAVGHFGSLSGTWALLPRGLIPALLILLVMYLVNRVPWPFSVHRRSYLLFGCAPVAVGAWLWTVLMNISSTGEAAPLPYSPILNPLDLSIGVITLVSIFLFLRL